MHRHLNRFKGKPVIVLVALLGIVLITAGATYAWFSYSKSGTKEHTISAGSITFHYKESFQGLTLDDAVPMTDSQGMAQTDYFDFTITSSTSNTVDIPYYITARRSGTGTNMDGVVKVYLTKVDGSNNETPVEIVSGKTIAKVSELGSYINNQGINTPATEKSLYNDKVWAGTENYTQKYRLRMWIDNDAQFIVQQEGQPDQYPYQGKTYTLTVNVYSSGVSVDQSTVDLRKNVNINSLQLGNDILVSTNDTYSANVEILPGETSVSKTLTVDTVNPNAKVSVQEVSAFNNKSKTEKLSTSKNLTLNLGTNDYNIIVTSEDGSTSKTYTLTVIVAIAGYTVTFIGDNIAFDSNSVTFAIGDTSKTVVATPAEGYYIDSVSCSNGYTADISSGASPKTITIRNNGNESNSSCAFSVATLPIANSFATDSWDTIVANVKANGGIAYTPTKDGFPEKAINLGTLGTHYLRVINTTSCDDAKIANPNLSSETACGFVIEFADIISDMSFRVVTSNGYPDSDMYKYVNNTVAPALLNALPTVARNAVLDTKVVSGHSVNTAAIDGVQTDANGNYITYDKLYLFSVLEVANIQLDDTWMSVLTDYDTSRQLDGYKDEIPSNNRKKRYAGNSVSSFLSRSLDGRFDTSNEAYYVTGLGTYPSRSAANTYISPAFRIG